MNVFLAFLLRDLSIEKTYRFNLLLKIGGVAMQLAIFFFISRFLEKPEYFIFVFIGIMFSNFFQFWLNIFAENIRQEQYWGTMEPVFLSPRRPLTVIFASVLGKFLLLLVELVFLFILGKLIFGNSLNLNIPAFLPLFVLNALAFGGIGLLSGSFIMYFKRGDPVNWILGAAFDLLSGIYFPVAVLPDKISWFCEKLPTSSALALWRGALLDGKTDISQFFVQAAWAVALLGAGIAAFSVALNRTKAKGELGNYSDLATKNSYNRFSPLLSVDEPAKSAGWNGYCFIGGFHFFWE